MPRARTRNPDNPLPESLKGTPYTVHSRPLAVSVYEKDLELLEWLTNYLGCSKSEAVRTAVRSMVAQLSAVGPGGPRSNES